MATVEEVRESLKTCFDPEIPVNIVDLGLVYGIEEQEGNVKVSMTLTSQHCPAAKSIPEDAKVKISALSGVKSVDIQIVWDPPWGPDKMSAEAKSRLGIE